MTDISGKAAVVTDCRRASPMTLPQITPEPREAYAPPGNRTVTWSRAVVPL